MTPVPTASDDLRAPAVAWDGLPAPWCHPLVPFVALAAACMLAYALPVTHAALVGATRLRALGVDEYLRAFPQADAPGLRDAATDVVRLRLESAAAVGALQTLVAALAVAGIAYVGLLARATRLTTRAALGVGALSVGAGLAVWALAYAATVIAGGLEQPALSWQGTTPLGLTLLGDAWGAVPFAAAVGLPWAVQAGVGQWALGRLAPSIPRAWAWGTAAAPLPVIILLVTLLKQASA